MDYSWILEKTLKIKSWKRKGERAPHKALLIMYALANFQRGKEQLLYSEAEPELTILLQEFGPPRKKHHPRYPFWRLQNDGIWNVSATHDLNPNKSGDVSNIDLIKQSASGSFTEPIVKSLKEQPELVSQIYKELLNANFPETVHEDIMQAMGFAYEGPGDQKRRTRSHKFREQVLQAYEYKCAICGFDIRMGHTPIALEAAHIKWHQAGGPDLVENGLALCALHHKLFDRGAFALTYDCKVAVSDKANGHGGFNEWLMVFNGKKIAPTQNKKYRPSNEYVDWHVKEVFLGEMRDAEYVY